MPLQPNTRDPHKRGFARSSLGTSVTTVPQYLGRWSQGCQQSPSRSNRLGWNHSYNTETEAKPELNTPTI